MSFFYHMDVNFDNKLKTGVECGSKCDGDAGKSGNRALIFIHFRGENGQFAPVFRGFLTQMCPLTRICHGWGDWGIRVKTVAKAGPDAGVWWHILSNI